MKYLPKNMISLVMFTVVMACGTLAMAVTVNVSNQTGGDVQIYSKNDFEPRQFLSTLPDGYEARIDIDRDDWLAMWQNGQRIRVFRA